MKTLFFIAMIIVFSNTTLAQETLYANDSHTMTLFFPSPIRQAVTGAEHFTFSYDRETAQYFGLLQGNEGTDSNLLVITQDGRAYAYDLEYRKLLAETFRFVDTFESIGRETETVPKQESLDSIPIPELMDIPNIDPREELWKKGAEYILERKTKGLRTKRKDGLVLLLKELFYHGNEVYMEIEIRNRSTINFEVDVLEVYTVHGKKGRRSSHQKVLMEPLLEYDAPKFVRVGQGHRFVIVLPKFTLGDSESLLLELQEKNGSRIIRLRYN